MWNKNERDGKIEEAKGKAKQVIGKATGNKDLTEEVGGLFPRPQMFFRLC